MAGQFLKTIHNNFDPGNLLLGQLYADAANDLFLFYYNSKWYISSHLGIKLQVTFSNSGKVLGSNPLTLWTDFYTSYGYPVFISSYGTSKICLYKYDSWFTNPSDAYSLGGNYVISSALNLACYEEWDNDAGAYAGDEFYSREYTSVTGEYKARGSWRGSTKNDYSGDTATVSIVQIDGWESDTLLGKYTACGTETGAKYVGLKKFTDQNGVEYLQSAEKNPDYINPPGWQYGSIHNDGTGWVIGTRDEGAWWSGSEPNVDSPVTFTKQGEASEDLIITFDNYYANSSKIAAYLGEVATFL